MRSKKIRHPVGEVLEGRRLVLGSKSPRRVELLRALGLEFEVHPSTAEEQIPQETPLEKVAEELAKVKAEALLPTLTAKELLITADTIVLHQNQILGKPKSLDEATNILSQLSDSWHTVTTGFALTTQEKQVSHSVESQIKFLDLTNEEIEYYITHYEVLDKAGAYGIQDWIGLIGVAEIRGSYHNVMGLPTATLYQTLKEFLGMER